MKAEETDPNIEKETPETETEAVEAEVIEEAAETGEGTEEPKELTIDELLEQSRTEKEELYQKVLRAAADFENFRKRSLREKDELRKYAVSSLIEDLLPALDNLDLGLMAADNDSSNTSAVTEGFRMVATQLKSILQQSGLEQVDPQGKEFDPNFHECLKHESSDELEDGKVITVVRKGYNLNGRILRAANVIVSSGSAEEKED